jgi:hypothetical protein
MLDKPQIQPQYVTKPIQLLAAWLVGLICIDGIFLEVALRLQPRTWERGWLVLAAILNVPAFLTAMFTLQTRFRAELQDDPHYAQYLSKKTSESLTVRRVDVTPEAVALPAARAPEPLTGAAADAAVTADAPAALDWSPWRIAINDHLPRFAEIRAALRLAGIPVAEIFGNSHRAAAAPPDNWVVSLNRALPAAHKAALLRVLLPFGLDGFQLWRPVADADESEDVYIGSYGVASYARFSDELAALLAGTPDDADLDRYRRQYKVRDERVGLAAAS